MSEDEIEVEVCNGDSSALRPGTLLCNGKYKVAVFLSSGGFGKTYEVEHILLHKRMAVKEFFPRDFCNRDKATSHVTVGTQGKQELVDKLRKKFVQEAQAIAQFNHPGIVKVSDVFEENGTAYYVMDYIEGGSLRDKVMSAGRLSEADAVRYIRQVCDALKYVHSMNRLHLDIKPGNIMVGPDGHATLIDFGSSKQYDEVSGENTSTLLGFTPGYAPPEQAAKTVSTFYPATDIYAVGATLYDMLTGKVPLEASIRSGGEELVPLPANITAKTRAAVEAAMRLNKKKRPQSVEEFLSFLDGGKPGPKPNPNPEPSPSLTKMAIVVGVIVALIVGVSVFFAVSSGSGGTDDEVTLIDTVVADTVVAEDVQVSVTTTATTGKINGHEWVDLGLSVKWATCNVGASSPSGYGKYYAWGETTTKSTYTKNNSKTYKNSSYDYDIGGSSSTDAARANWGGSWRLPTEAEMEELVNKCTWTWKGSGILVTGPNGNSIFLPASGFRSGKSLNSAGSNGCYWGSPEGSNSENAYALCFDSSTIYAYAHRHRGLTVRPVSN